MSINRSVDTPSKKVRDNFNHNVMGKGFKIPAGIYRGVVVNNSDPEKKWAPCVYNIYGRFKNIFSIHQSLSWNVF